MRSVIFGSVVVLLVSLPLFAATPQDNFYKLASVSKLSCEWRGEEDCYLDFIESMAPVLLVRPHQKGKEEQRKINYIKKIQPSMPWYQWAIVFLLSAVTYLLCLRFARQNIKH